MAAKNEKLLKEFGKKIKKLRMEKGLSTRQFAYAADIAHSAVGRLEAGLSNPTLTTFLKVAEALEVDLDELVPGK
jgi:transcriptional regulator with XRE-family HTH domain